MTAEIRGIIAHHRDDIVEQVRLRQTVANILALSSHELEHYQREIDNAPPDDPWIDHDRRAYEIATQEGSRAA